MIGKQIDVTLFDKKEAVNFIKTKCTDCDIKYFCNGNDCKMCNDKIDYLINKFKIDS